MDAFLDALFAPLGADRFFAERFEKHPLHLVAPRPRPPLLTHAELLDALSRSGGCPAGVVVFPEHGGTTREALFTDPARMAAYLDEGHPLVWNRARGVSERVDAMTELLSEELGAHVWPNVYATGTAGTPFDMHFDAHEVIAVQCEGEKDWQISEVRVDRPLDADEMEPAVGAALVGRRDEAASRILGAFTSKQGDLVYIPRGQFHNAKATKGRSLHVTFGIRLPSGFDLARRIVLDLLSDPAFREYMPARAVDPDGSLSTAHLADVAARLARAFRGEALVEAEGALRTAWTTAGPGKSAAPAPPGDVARIAY